MQVDGEGNHFWSIYSANALIGDFRDLCGSESFRLICELVGRLIRAENLRHQSLLTIERWKSSAEALMARTSSET